MRRVLFFVLFFLLATPLRAQPSSGDHPVDTELQAKLERLVEGFRGDVGLYVRHLPSGRTAALHADTLFPTASMIKVPILLKTFDLLEKGDRAYDVKLVYRDSLRYPGEDLLGAFKDSAAVTLSKVVMLMITTSDNTASLWLQHLAGTGTAINAWLAAHGFEGTRVNSRTGISEAHKKSPAGRTDEAGSFGSDNRSI